MDSLRIGLWVPEKKKGKMQLTKFEQLCRKRGTEVIYLDLSRSLEDQGPFDIILHKLSDGITVAADNGDSEALSGLDNFRSYVTCHPEVPVVDPLERTQPLRDRCVMFHLLHKACQSMSCPSDNIKIFVPNYVELSGGSTERQWFDLMQEANVQFPVVCKPSDAGIPETAHDMSLVFAEQGLLDVAPPCVAQTFINHDGILYKIFVFGEKHFVTVRPSIKNVNAGGFKTEHFTTNDVSKPDSESHLIHKTTSTARESNMVRINNDVIKCIAQEVRRTLAIDLMGIDVIISSRTGNYAIIDVNPFPGFNGIPEIHEKLLDFLKKKAAQNKPIL